MNASARAALHKLLGLAENAWGRSPDEPVHISLRFSQASLPAYLAIGSHSERHACHADLQLAQQRGAVSIEWDQRAGEQRQIVRIQLVDRDKLASILGEDPLWKQMETASVRLEPQVSLFPVLAQVFSAWRRGTQCRGTLPTDWQIWEDAARVVRHCRDSGSADQPIRRLSTTLFSDSKRIEALWPAMDVLLQADALAPPRMDEEVYGELGLVKFPPTLLLAGDAQLHCGQIETPLLRPYVGFAPRAVNGFRGLEQTRQLISVENLTTFHELCGLLRPGDGRLLIYSAGMPSPSWLRIYDLLHRALPDSAKVLHWGDVDSGGFRIAAYIAKAAAQHGRRLHLYGMDGKLCTHDRPAVVRKALKDAEVNAIVRICERFGWAEEGAWLSRSRHAIEQESMRLELP
ncbi:Wadjet anti-phage system protein JetD domain-containing protein [Variovorax rhizosphaerae]|uniref:Wadjet anti-phage system protein JetD domain-containing protein n=1 Tax=Variovorax rhizosphaerae TaxID=1836200 RepID=A0ABU8WUJ4_9BURK